MTDPNISPEGYWRWNGAQWVPNVAAQAQALAPTGTPGRREWITGGVVGAAVLAPVIFADSSIGEGIGEGMAFGLWG